MAGGIQNRPVSGLDLLIENLKNDRFPRSLRSVSPVPLFATPHQCYPAEVPPFGKYGALNGF